MFQTTSSSSVQVQTHSIFVKFRYSYHSILRLVRSKDHLLYNINTTQIRASFDQRLSKTSVLTNWQSVGIHRLQSQRYNLPVQHEPSFHFVSVTCATRTILSFCFIYLCSTNHPFILFHLPVKHEPSFHFVSFSCATRTILSFCFIYLCNTNHPFILFHKRVCFRLLYPLVYNALILQVDTVSSNGILLYNNNGDNIIQHISLYIWFVYTAPKVASV